jgi:hypothetical protein
LPRDKITSTVASRVSSALTEAQNLSIVEMRAHRSAAEHGAVRFQLGFDVEQGIADYGLLRDVIQKFAEAHGVNISGEVNCTQAPTVSLLYRSRPQDADFRNGGSNVRY